MGFGHAPTPTKHASVALIQHVHALAFARQAIVTVTHAQHMQRFPHTRLPLSQQKYKKEWSSLSPVHKFQHGSCTFSTLQCFIAHLLSGKSNYVVEAARSSTRIIDKGFFQGTQTLVRDAGCSLTRQAIQRRRARTCLRTPLIIQQHVHHDRIGGCSLTGKRNTQRTRTYRLLGHPRIGAERVAVRSTLPCRSGGGS